MSEIENKFEKVSGKTRAILINGETYCDFERDTLFFKTGNKYIRSNESNNNPECSFIIKNKTENPLGLELGIEKEVNLFLGDYKEIGLHVIHITKIKLLTNVQDVKLNFNNVYELKNKHCQIEFKKYENNNYKFIKYDLVRWKEIDQIENRVSSVINRTLKKEIPYNSDSIRKLLSNSKNNCEYCGIAQNTIDELNENITEYGLTTRDRGYALEIDQINPREGYIDGNMVLCCYWCNNAKTDTFSVSEFKPIARGINQAWNQKLKKIGYKGSICFPENSNVWDSKEDN